MTDALDAEFAKIGAVHFTMEYRTPVAARAAWERAQKRCRNIAVCRHALGGDMGKQAVTVLAEENDDCAPQVEKARRLLAAGGREIDTPADVLEVLRKRRRESLVIALASGRSKRVVRYGEQGAPADPATGRSVLRRNQG